MDWNDLKYCTHVAREGSTLAAARALDISQTTVMRRIAALEDALGYELFEKRRAGYVPTDALKALLPRLDAIEVAHTAFEHEAAHTGRSLKGTVRLTASELMVAQFLSSALVVFSAEYPDIRIELFTTDRFLDLSRGEADIALRAGDPPTEASLFGRCIVPSDIWHVCCSRLTAQPPGSQAPQRGLRARGPVPGPGQRLGGSQYTAGTHHFSLQQPHDDLYEPEGWTWRFTLPRRSIGRRSRPRPLHATAHRYRQGPLAAGAGKAEKDPTCAHIARFPRQPAFEHDQGRRNTVGGGEVSSNITPTQASSCLLVQPSCDSPIAAQQFVRPDAGTLSTSARRLEGR